MGNRELDLAKRREAWLDDPRREALEDALLDAAAEREEEGEEEEGEDRD